MTYEKITVLIAGLITAILSAFIKLASRKKEVTIIEHDKDSEQAIHDHIVDGISDRL